MNKIVVSFLIIILISSCVSKDEYDFDKLAKTSWTPQVGFPLLKSNLGVDNLMGNTDSNAVTSDVNGLVVLKYRQDAQIIKASDFINFDASLFMSAPSIPLVPGGPYLVTIPFDTNSGVDLTKLVIETGSMVISLEPKSGSSFTQMATYDFLTLKNNSGNNLSVKVPISPNSSKTVDLSGHSLGIDASGNFSINITIPSGVSGLADPVIRISNLVYRRLEGDFKNKIISMPKDSIKLHIFKNLAAQGELHVDDPKINIDVKNGFGVPVALDLTSLYGYNTVSNVSTFIAKPGQGVFNVSQGNSASPVLTSIKLDKNNSNLNNVMQPTPMYMGHHIMAESNPGSTGTNMNVLDKDATLEVSTLLELPLKGRIKGLAIVDTVPFSINESFDLIKDMAINTAIKNGFPFGVKLTLELLDENYEAVNTEAGHPIFLVKDREIATSGIVNSSSGRIDQETLETISSVYEIGNEQVKELLRGKFVRIVGVVETFNTGNQVIGIYDNYSFDLRVGVKITGNLTL